MKAALSSSFWNGNAQAEARLIEQMPRGSQKLLHALRTPRTHADGAYSISLLERSYVISGLDQTGVQRLGQAYQLAPVLPVYFRELPAITLAESGVLQPIVEGAPLRKALEKCALSLDDRPPLTAPGYLRSLAHLRTVRGNFGMPDHSALSMYFHARPQAAPFSASAFAKDRHTGDTRFGAAARLAGFENSRAFSTPTPDTITFLRQAEILARAIDMRRLKSGGVSRPTKAADRHILRDSHRWLANAIGAVAGGALHDNTDSLQANLAASTLLMPRGRSEKAFHELNALVHKRMIQTEPARASLEAQFDLENRASGGNALAVEPFPHFLTEAAKISGVTIEPLRSHERLIAEGKDLSHCVGGYRHDAQAGETMIVGISSAQGRSTAEIHLDASRIDADFKPLPPRLTIVQHRSVGNGDPSPEHFAALSELLAQTERKAAAIARVPAERHQDLAQWTDQARTHYRRTNKRSFTSDQQDRYRDMLFEQIKPFLSRPEREMTRSQWVEKAAPARLAALTAVHQTQRRESGLTR